MSMTLEQIDSEIRTYTGILKLLKKMRRSRLKEIEVAKQLEAVAQPLKK